jgi:hypothetical protein
MYGMAALLVPFRMMAGEVVVTIPTVMPDCAGTPVTMVPVTCNADTGERVEGPKLTPAEFMIMTWISASPPMLGSFSSTVARLRVRLA